MRLVMEYVVTSIAGSGYALPQDFAESMSAAPAMQGVRVASHQWLKPGVAVDVFVTGLAPDVLDGRVQDALRGKPVDAIVQPAPKRKRKLLISDMDSTMITCECIDELADFAGKKAEVAALTERAMRGDLLFEDTLAQRVALLAGLPESVLQQCFDERVKPMPGAKELLAAHKAAGGISILVSGGFTFFTSRVRSMLGFDEDHSNQLEVKDGKLTGKVISPILGKEAKLAILQASCRKLGITTDDALAVGDGANDLPMLLAAGMGVAYHAKPVVRAQAKARIDHADLSALLYV